VSLQGNLDPAALFAPSAAIRGEVGALLESYGPWGPGAGHVFNLGHGISQFTPPEAVAELVRAVHELSQVYHAES
jgi:uroporphyrinogen decarboxylase